MKDPGAMCEIDAGLAFDTGVTKTIIGEEAAHSPLQYQLQLSLEG
jgi:hypothetical protein